MPATRQLLLPFPEEPGYDAADFVASPSNAQALAWLGRTPDWPDRRLALWGAPGCGKTHLLRIWAAKTGAWVLSGPALAGLPAALPAGGIAIDDADMVQSETTLLHWLNMARDESVPVLLTGRQPPMRYPVRLADLTSRLRAILAVEIEAPDDSLLRALLAHLLSDRQWRLDARAQDRVLPLLPRDPGRLREAVARLDRALLASGARLTHKLIDEVLAEMPPDDNDDGW